MRWHSYSETRGRLAGREVVIRFDPRDRAHPFLLRRIAEYESRGKAVVLKAAPPKGGRKQGVPLFARRAIEL